MSHEEPLQTSSITTYPLSSFSSRQAMAIFTQLFSSCVGPYGKNHLIRNACGGHLTISSTCFRLLSSISFTRSELKLIVSAVTGHLQQHGDCGLFMIHMCLDLTMSTLNMNIHHDIVSSTFLSFVSIIVNYVKSENCDIRIKSDFSNINLLLYYIRSILSSKTLLSIQPKQLNNLSLIVLNAFVRAIPSVPSHRYSNGVFLLGQEKLPLSECKCQDGILIEFPELILREHCDELMNKVNSKLCKNNEFIKVALVTCSMSGEMEDVLHSTVEGTLEQFNDLEECVYQKMASFCNRLERENVAFILCQKVIHPRLKDFFKSKGIIYMDRLGSQPIPFIRDLTGCHPITSVIESIGDKNQYFGKLTSVSPCIINKQSYLCLNNSNANVVTLILCSDFEERLSELKYCVSASLKGLESLAKEPWLLMGGGCWQMHCSQHLKEKVLSTLPEMCERLKCSETNLRRLLHVFRSCLHKWCLRLKHNMDHLSFDLSSFHCWKVSKNISLNASDKETKLCSCGFKYMSRDDLHNLDILSVQDVDNHLLKRGDDVIQQDVKDVDEYDKVVLDNFTACMEALHKGVLTAGLLLSIGLFICDRN